MADVVRFVVTDAGRSAFKRAALSGDTVQFSYFKLGEGGSVEVMPGIFEPKEPDPSLTDIEAEGFGVNGLFFFQDTFDVGELVDIDATSFRAIARAETTEANDRGDTDPPKFFEVGYFNSDDDMLVYGTYPAVEKLPAFARKCPVKMVF